MAQTKKKSPNKSFKLNSMQMAMWEELFDKYGYSTDADLLRDMLRQFYRLKTNKEVPADG